MFDSIIHFSIKNKLVIALMVLGLICWGIYSLKQLPVDAVPDITNNQVQVITVSPALSAQEIERFITAPLEISFANIPDQTEIRSISRSGLSVITVVFKDETDIYRARQLVAEQIKMAQQVIPAGSGVPELAPITTGLGEIYQYVIDVKPGFESKYSLSDLRTIQDWIVKRQLAGVEGIADISSFGGLVKQYEVSFDPEKLRSFNLSLQDIFGALTFNNENTGGSYIEKNHNAYFIRGEGLAASIEDLENIVIKSDAAIPVLIKDIATVHFGNAVRYGALSKNGREVAGGILLMLKGANTEQVIKRVEKRIAQIQKSLPEGLKITPFINRADLIERAIGTVEKNLIEGGLIVIFVLVLLLGNFRAGLIVASVIPLALLFAFCMMHLFGVSANLMSLGAIDFGLVVDGAVIIVEAIIHQLSMNGNSTGKILSQEEMDDTVYHASVKIRTSAAFGEIIILMVYLPILALAGIEGKMFKPMAQTVSFAIVGALILSLTYIPMISSFFLSKKTRQEIAFADKIIHFLYGFYKPALEFALKNRWVITFMAVVIFSFSAILFSSLGGEFLPALEEGDFAVDTRLTPGSSLTETVNTFSKAEKIISRFPEVKQVVGRMGSSEIPTDPMPLEVGDLMIILKDKKEWTSATTMAEMGEKMKAALSAIPGCQFEFLQPIQMRTNELISGVRADVGIKIFGDDLNILYHKAMECANLIKNIRGISDLKVEQIEGLPQMMIKYKRQRIAQYGVDIKTLNSVIRASFAGESAGFIYEGEKRFELVVRMDKIKRADIADIGKIYIDVPVKGKSGQSVKVPLEEVAEISFQDAPVQVSRQNSRRRITVTFNVRKRDVESTVEEAQNIMNSRLKLPSGYYYTFGGQFENLIEAKKRLSIAVPVALIMIFVLLYFTFHSVKESALIFTAIPLSAIGGVVALWVRGMYFSISAGVGFIALFGVAVLNGIVLVSYMNQLEKEGITNIRERIIKATQVRFRPVIMTAMVASLGFLPMALSHTAGAEVQRPLATVVIGGLVSATLLTLIILPVIYSLTFEGNTLQKITAKKLPLAMLFLAGSFLLSLPAQAQVDPNALSLEEAISLGVENSFSLKASSLLIDEQKSLVKSSVDLPKTLFDLQYGKVQDPHYNDYTITAIQQFSSPTFYAAQRNLANSNVVSAEKRLAIDKTILIQNIRLTYYQLLYTYQLKSLLTLQDSIYTEAYRVAALRFKTGETNNLENVSALARSREVQNRLEMLEADTYIQKTNLQRFLNAPYDSIDISYQVPLKRLPANMEILLAKDVGNNPSLQYFQQQTLVSQKLISLEKQRLFPTFSAGYFYQTLLRTPNNNGIFAGLGVPLWFTANQAKIQAARIFKAATEKQLEYNRLQLSSELKIQMQLYNKYLKSISYFETYALPQAAEIIKNANKGYTSGDLDYVEFVQSLGQAWQIRENYLTTLQSYNQALIQVEALLGL